MQCWRGKKLSLLSVKKEIRPLQAVRPWASVEMTSSWWKTGCSVKEWEVSSSLFWLEPYSGSGQDRERVKRWVDVIWTPGNKQHSRGLAQASSEHSPASSEHSPKLSTWCCTVKSNTPLPFLPPVLRAGPLVMPQQQHLICPLPREPQGSLAMPNHRRKPVLLPAPGTPGRWGVPCLNHRVDTPEHLPTQPQPTQCGEDATEDSRLPGNPRDQTGTHSHRAMAMLLSQIPFLFPLPFLTAARFQLHLAALSRALQAHKALLLHGYNSQPYTKTGFVFHFLINTLYIKEKGLQFAVSTQRAREKKKRKKERLKNLNHKG